MLNTYGRVLGSRLAETERLRTKPWLPRRSPPSKWCAFVRRHRMRGSIQTSRVAGAGTGCLRPVRGINRDISTSAGQWRMGHAPAALTAARDTNREVTLLCNGALGIAAQCRPPELSWRHDVNRSMWSIVDE